MISGHILAFTRVFAGCISLAIRGSVLGKSILNAVYKATITRLVIAAVLAAKSTTTPNRFDVKR